MKREYEKPSMAMNLFETTDNTNVTVQSAVAPKSVEGKSFYRTGINVINGDRLNS